MSIHDRVRSAVVQAIQQRPLSRPMPCATCRGMRLVIQISPAMHDAWALEARAITGRQIHTITHYEGIPVRQLPNLPDSTAQVVTCWDCCGLPAFPDDPEAIERFLK